jgi:hypothetical protein
MALFAPGSITDTGGVMRTAVMLLVGLFVTGCIRISLIPEIKGMEEQVVGGQGKNKVVVVDVSGIIALGPIGLERFSREPSLLPRL